MKKHLRKIVAGVRELGHQVELEHPSGTGHMKIRVTLKDGREALFPVACTPREANQALKNAIRQIRGWERSGQESPRRSTW